MRILLLFTFIFAAYFSYGQDSVVKVNPRSFPDKGGIVAYYFWEEDSNGYIIDKPKASFLHNSQVEIPKTVVKNGSASILEVERAVSYFAAEPGTSEAEEEYYFKDSLKKVTKLKFSLRRTKATDFSSVIFRRHENNWQSITGKPVLYFSVDGSGKLKYVKSADVITFPDGSPDKKTDGQYTVLEQIAENGKPFAHQVFNFEGKDVTALLSGDSVSKPFRMLLFINGYRGPKRNDQPSDGVVTQKDRFGYWYKLDNQFIDVLKPEVSYFVDGSLPIATSNHKTNRGFAWSFLRTKLTLRKKKSRIMARRLNTVGNNPGFDDRVEKGKLGGLAFLAARCDSPECEKTKDTIDIVCHSMGYAYALGFLEVTEKRFILGNIYILAPENACYKGYDWSKFQHVWQYGSDLDQENPSSISKQDGIAPQCAVKGLDKLPADKGGRAFFPKDWPKQNFVDSHMIYSYDWIFQRIKFGETGFISK